MSSATARRAELPLLHRLGSDAASPPDIGTGKQRLRVNSRAEKKEFDH